MVYRKRKVPIISDDNMLIRPKKRRIIRMQKKYQAVPFVIYKKKLLDKYMSQLLDRMYLLLCIYATEVLPSMQTQYKVSIYKPLNYKEYTFHCYVSMLLKN